jgi:hypothetical protein
VLLMLLVVLLMLLLLGRNVRRRVRLHQNLLELGVGHRGDLRVRIFIPLATEIEGKFLK